jgi:hypothetical protein
LSSTASSTLPAFSLTPAHPLRWPRLGALQDIAQKFVLQAGNRFFIAEAAVVLLFCNFCFEQSRL